MPPQRIAVVSGTRSNDPASKVTLVGLHENAQLEVWPASTDRQDDRAAAGERAMTIRRAEGPTIESIASVPEASNS